MIHNDKGTQNKINNLPRTDQCAKLGDVLLSGDEGMLVDVGLMRGTSGIHLAHVPHTFGVNVCRQEAARAMTSQVKNHSLSFTPAYLYVPH